MAKAKRGLKLVNSRTVTFKTLRYDFDNGLAYVEQKVNNRLQDCFFVEKDDLWPDGSVKIDGIKYFHCNDDFVEKKVKPINCTIFDEFEYLYYIDQHGEIKKRFNVDDE